MEIMKNELFKECYKLGKALDEPWEDGNAWYHACNRWGKLMADIRMCGWYNEYISWCCDLEFSDILTNS